MSLIEIARLSAAQQAQLGPYGQRWAGLRASTAAGDRKAAEAGVVTAYAAAGLPPPRDIVWAGGPAAIARADPLAAGVELRVDVPAEPLPLARWRTGFRVQKPPRVSTVWL